MGISKNLRGLNLGDKVAEEAQVTRKAVPAAARKAAPAKAGEAKQTDARAKETREDREALIKEKFVPEAVAFLKEQLGVDLYAISKNNVYNLADGRLTTPMTVTVTPLVYDRKAKANVEAKPLTACVSLIVNMPLGKDYRPIAPDSEHPIRVKSFPFVNPVALTPGEDAVEEGVAPGEAPQRDERPEPAFSDEQKMALAAIGVNDDRLYNNGFRHFDKDTKYDIIQGEEFEFIGQVDTSFGHLNVNGYGRLTTYEDGTAMAEFEPIRPQRLSEAEEKELGEGVTFVPDITSINSVGNVEFILFSNDREGGITLNQAGRDLCDFGVCLEPVDARVYSKMKDVSGVDRLVSKNVEYPYQVVMANGSLLAVPIKNDGMEMNAKLVNGEQVKVQNPVTLKYETLSFVSDEERENFKKGFGKVKDVTFKVGSRNVKRDVYVYPDPKNNGFASFLIPDVRKEGFTKKLDEMTKKLDARREQIAEKQRASARRAVRKKANFRLG